MFVQLVVPSTPIHTNDIKKGARVLLRSGWEADVWDNARGDTRVCDVYGDFHEAGSVYSHDIIAVKWDGVWMSVTHTDKQLKLMKMVQAMGM
jgi:hypothetical protein